MNPYTVLTLTEHPGDDGNSSTERLRVRIEGQLEPAKLIEVMRLLNKPQRKTRADAGKARKEQQP